jgi:hypothetical protein
MRASLPLFSAALFATAAFAQRDLPTYITREMKFEHANSAQQYQEIATVLRGVGQLPFVQLMETAGRISFRGPREALPACEWLVRQLDKPRPAQLPAASEIFQGEPHPHGEDRFRVFHLAHAASPQQLQETATVLRDVVLLRYVITYNETRAVAIRGTEEQIKFAARLLAELDRQPGKAATTGREYTTRNRRFEYGVRVFVLRPTTIANADLVAELRKAVGGSPWMPAALPAVVVQADAEHMEAVRKLIQERGW